MSFSYKGSEMVGEEKNAKSESAIISNLDLTINAGETVAIVGRTDQENQP